MNQVDSNRVHFDPYDIWALPSLGRAKIGFYKGSFVSKLKCAFIALVDYLFPLQLRALLNVEKAAAAHTVALMWMAGRYDLGGAPASDISGPELLDFIEKSAISVGSGVGWGLPFAWWSKNGVYPANTAYITNTPYIMECLLILRQDPAVSVMSESLFNRTFLFLRELAKHVDTAEYLASSYAAIDEPRLVTNANSYAMLAYAMHSIYGDVTIRDEALNCASRTARWLISQQNSDGSWWYYADTNRGNFIDCFHSCFVLKNLKKTTALLPGLEAICSDAIERGWTYIRRSFRDNDIGLCRRFVTKDFRDPYAFDLYDQAEFMGLLIDFDCLAEAQVFRDAVRRNFFQDGHWYVRIDRLNRRWGRDFMRWGIVPFLYHEARLQHALAGAQANAMEIDGRCHAFL